MNNEALNETTSYLIVTPYEIGVTNDLSDIQQVIASAAKEGSSVLVQPGEKTELLQLEHKVICHDNINRIDHTGEYHHPALHTDFNLIKREASGDNRKLLRLLA